MTVVSNVLRLTPEQCCTAKLTVTFKRFLGVPRGQEKQKYTLVSYMLLNATELDVDSIGCDLYMEGMQSVSG